MSGKSTPRRAHPRPHGTATEAALRPAPAPGRARLLSVLKEDGSAAPAHDPGLPTERLVHLYSAMVRAREFDRRMLALHALYPAYGFDVHKGYGTHAHMRALLRHGPCPQHRMSFRPVREAYRIVTGDEATP